jgi:hypothetical protein
MGRVVIDCRSSQLRGRDFVPVFRMGVNQTSSAYVMLGMATASYSRLGSGEERPERFSRDSLE